MAISGYCCCFWNFSGWREIFQSVWGCWRWCQWVRYPEAQAGWWCQTLLLVLVLHPTLTFVICWGGKTLKINSFDSNMCQGTAEVLSGRDTGPGHCNLGCGARPGSAGAPRVPTSPPGHGDMVGPCTLLFLSLPWYVLLAVVTGIAFESEEG